MALITKATNFGGLATLVPPHNCVISGNLFAGEAIAAGDVCYIKSDGLAWLAIGTSDVAAARGRGIAPRDYMVGQAVTLYRGVRFTYTAASGLTPGAPAYLSGTTAGALNTATSTGGSVAIAYAVSDTDLFFYGDTR